MQLAFQLPHVATTQLCVSPQSNSSKSMHVLSAHGDSINKTPANNECPLFILVVVHLFHFLTIKQPLGFWSQFDFSKIKSFELFQAEYFYVLKTPFIVILCETVLNGCLINEDDAFCTEIKYLWCYLDNRAFLRFYIRYNIIGICSYLSSFTSIALMLHWALLVHLVARQRWEKAFWTVNKEDIVELSVAIHKKKWHPVFFRFLSQLAVQPFFASAEVFEDFVPSYKWTSYYWFYYWAILHPVLRLSNIYDLCITV